MALAPGTRFGVYEVTAQIGEGGMGQVYRATDTKLKRQVAIKILPPSLAVDPDRLARFRREAEVLASLNHPNIAAIYGLEEDGGVTALVMELVEGDDLSRRIAIDAIPLDEALPIAKQIADALEAAHDQGIIHRDLKPANIKVRSDGTVKVLDFGLAKAIVGADGTGVRGSGGAADSPTITTPGMTQAGMILGTAAYMSPEQARGKTVDKRADIWAFGCVVFEMLTGRQAFAGETVTDILAAVVKNEPDWDALPANTPRALRSVLRRCLTKDVKLRLRDIGDGRLEVLEPDAAPVIAAAGPKVPSARRWLIPVAIAALAIGAIGGVLWRASRDVRPEQWSGSRLGGPAVALYPRVSPDGQLLAFQAMVDGLTQVAVMKPGTGNWTVLTSDRTKGLVDSLGWAHDGGRVYFDRWTDGPLGVFSVPALGGTERLLIENASSPQSLPDGSLLLLRINADRVLQLHRFWPDTGKLEPLPAITNRSGYVGPFRPLDADRIAVVGRPVADVAGQDKLYVLTLSTGQMTRFGPDLAGDDIVSVTVRPEDPSVLLSVRDGSAFRVMQMWPDGTREPETVLTFLSQPYLDASPDGSLFLALTDRPVEIVHFREGSGVVDHWATGLTFVRNAVGLTGGRYLITERLGASAHVLLATPGKEPVRLVETTEDTRWPMTPVGTDRVALLIGSGATPDIGVVAVDSGRILKRLKAPGSITSLSASPEGTVLYATAGGVISALPIDGGTPRTLGPGDSVTVDLDTGDLIVKLDEVNGYRLVRLAPAGGTPAPITIDSSLRLVSEPLIAGAVRNGRLVLPVATPDSWYWHPAAIDLRTGKIQKLSLEYFTDFHAVAWATDGSIIGSALGAQAALWKFTPGTKRK